MVRQAILLRQTIQTVTQSLAGRNIPVTQRGLDAFVEYDKATGQAKSINIPTVADNASELYLQAIQGFIDHEVGHILHTDSVVYMDGLREWGRLGRNKRERDFLADVHNALEDVHIERAQERRFLGSRHNLGKTRELLIDKRIRPGVLSNPEDAKSLLLAPLFRAWAGQEEFVSLFREPEIGSLIEPLAALFPQALRERIGRCASSVEARDLTREVFSLLCKERCEDDGSDQGGQASKGQGVDEAQGLGQDQHGGQGRDVMSLPEIQGVGLDLAELISQVSQQQARNADYLVYSRDFDWFGVWESPASSVTELAGMRDRVDHVVGPLAQHMERILRVRGLAYWSGGHRRGRIDRRAMSRLALAGRHRELDTQAVYKQKELADVNDVAVSILVDCSRSMRRRVQDGVGRIYVALDAAYGVALTFQRLGIAIEVMGFTTRIGEEAETYLAEVRSAERRDGCDYARYLPLHMPVLKCFDERMTPKVAQRFADYPSRGVFGGTVIGEPVRFVAERLQARPESGRLLVVLTDGMPDCPGSADMNHHARASVASVEASLAIDVVGIGIGIDVGTIFSHSMRIDHVDQLTKVLVDNLRGYLLKQVSIR